MDSYKEELKEVRALSKMVRKAVEHLAKYEEEACLIGGNGSCNLAGYCARASYLLSMALERAQIHHFITGGNGHIFIKWQDKIVDVTATQFSGRLGKTVIRSNVSLGKEVGVNKFWYWQRIQTFSDKESLLQWQIDNHWPDSQMHHSWDNKFLDGLKEYKEYLSHGV